MADRLRTEGRSNPTDTSLAVSERLMIGGRSAETIRVHRDRIDDCRQPTGPHRLSLAQAGLSIDVSGLWLERCVAPGHNGYQRAVDLITGQASIGPKGSPVFDRAGKTVLHLGFSLADLGG